MPSSSIVCGPICMPTRPGARFGAEPEACGDVPASAASDDIQADLQALRDDVTRLATQITDIFSAKGNVAWSRAKANVEGVVSDVGAKGQEAIDAAQEVRDKVVDAIDESLETRPYTTLAMALGIGFLLGAMWRR